MTKDKLTELIENYAQARADVETAKQDGWNFSELMIVQKVCDAYKGAVMKAVEGLYESKSGKI